MLEEILAILAAVWILILSAALGISAPIFAVMFGIGLSFTAVDVVIVTLLGTIVAGILRAL